MSDWAEEPPRSAAQDDTDWAEEEAAGAVLAGEENTDDRTDIDRLASDDAAEPALYFGSVDEFVREYLRSVYRRPINGRTRVWAARWWDYPEAVVRLEALWRAWEHLRQDPTIGMSVWWRDHADHHMAVLMDPDGPFAGAKADADENVARRGQLLPYEAPPPDLFPDLRRASK